MKKNLKKLNQSYKLTLVFVLSVGIVLLASMVFAFAGSYFLVYFSVISASDRNAAYLVLVCLVSVVIGLGFALIVSRFLLRPINGLMYGMRMLSLGDYSMRLDLGESSISKRISTGFNNMAQELDNTHMMRADFINNFSHEFKTPVASIKGLLELLKKEDLPEEKRREYLGVVEEEINRLFDMSSRILDLSKIESRSSLSSPEQFNVCEQVRSCILLLEAKWSKKYVQFDLALGEHEITAEKELLAHVWLNLLDNAIKFTSDNGYIKVGSESTDTACTVFIENSGDEIREDEKEKIFQKFYQADNTHTRQGNGIGLSIVKHIVNLHKGKIEVTSGNGRTRFSVTLPKTVE